MTVTKEQAQALLDAATPGPWAADTEVRGDCVVWGPDGQFLMNAQAEPHWLPDANGEKRQVAFDVDARDVQLIAAAPDLARTVVEQAEVIERVRAVMDEWEASAAQPIAGVTRDWQARHASEIRAALEGLK